MNEGILKCISNFTENNISTERKIILNPLIEYIQLKINNSLPIRLNFICTHNSRRSHLSQIWAQTMAYQFEIRNVTCYSGGTIATAMFPKIADTLENQGFQIITLSKTENPVYAVKFDVNENPIICFSKVYNHIFNPQHAYAAIVTCNNADENCPLVIGAEKRIPIKYDDPKAFDNTNQMNEKYHEKSIEIAQEMWYVFSQIRK